jgi:hypothetical protein
VLGAIISPDVHEPLAAKAAVADVERRFPLRRFSRSNINARAKLSLFQKPPPIIHRCGLDASVSFPIGRVWVQRLRATGIGLTPTAFHQLSSMPTRCASR